MSFAKLKASRKENFTKLQNKLADQAAGKGEYPEEEGYWQPTVDKDGNGWAIIRWMPAPPEEDLPYVQIYTHGFKGPGGWYIEKCLTTINQTDPAVEYSTALWDTGTKENKARVSGSPGNPGTKRKNNFHSNIYVVKDPGNPEAEGKLWKFKYGPKIFEFLNDAMNPKLDIDEPWDPFDLWEGANFIIKCRKVDGYRNYGKSEWAQRGPLLDGDEEKLEALYNSLPSLAALKNPKEFKTYDELKKRLAKVLGGGEVQAGDDDDAKTETVETQNEGKAPWEEEVQSAIKSRRSRTSKVQPKQEKETAAVDTEDTDNNLEFFQSLRDK